MWRNTQCLAGILALMACGGAPMPAQVEDAGAWVRISPSEPIRGQGPNCILDSQCALIEESCPCRCRLNTEPAALTFPNVVCVAAAFCSPCGGKLAFCDHGSFTCKMK